MEQTGTLDHAAAVEARPASVSLSWLATVLKAAAPWAVIIALWEWAAAAGWTRRRAVSAALRLPALCRGE
jgi:hypothetical protein